MDNQNRKICMKCGVPITPGSAFCTACGAPVPADERKICVKCGVPIAPGSAFCTACGAPAPGSASAAPQPQLSPEELNQRKYDAAVALLKADKVTESDLNQAIANLKGMLDFKDSKDQVAKLEKRLEQWKKDKAAAEAAEKARQAQKKAKMKKIIIIAAIAFVLVVAAVVTLIVLNIPYTISVNGVEIEYNMLSDDIVLEAPEITGYDFIGWTGTGLDGPTKEVTIGKFSSGDREYTPNYEPKKFTVALNANGGSGVVATLTAVYGATYNLPTPTRTGYTFNGWYNGDEKIASKGSWLELDITKLEAKWTANEYTLILNNSTASLTVTWDYNYSGASPYYQTLYNGETLSYWMPSRSGYIFMGWYTDAACTTAYGFASEISGDITLYAKWTSIPYYGYSEGQIDPSSYTSSNPYSFYISSSTYSSYPKYLYLVANETGTHKIYYSSYDYDTYYLSIYNYTSSTTILTAMPVSNYYYSYTSFDCQAGDIIIVSAYDDYYSADGYLYFEGFAPITSTAKVASEQLSYSSSKSSYYYYDYDEAFTLPTITRKGHTFEGWYDADGNKVESGVWNFDKDLSLTPKFTAGGNTITLNPNGGTVDSTTLSVTYGASYVLPTPTRTGYTFDGWYIGSESGSKLTSGTWTYEEDMTLVAKWSVKEYYVVLDDTTNLSYITVTYAYNYVGAGTYDTDYLYEGSTPYYYTPSRSGYVFTGWYTDSSCTTKYDFAGTITSNLTLYAGWTEMTMTNVNYEFQIDPTDYTSSYDYYYRYASSTSASYQDHIYIVANETGTHYIYYANDTSNIDYSYYMRVYNLTTGVVIQDYINVATTYYDYIEFECDAGDVIVISLYDYYYSPDVYLYFEGFGEVNTTATADPGLTYDASSSYGMYLEYGEAFTLPTLTRSGYTFDGWYYGDTKVESGTWSIDSNVTLVPKWK